VTSNIASRSSPIASPPIALPSNPSAAKLGVDPALGDPEAELTVRTRSVPLALGPQRGATHRRGQFAARHARGRHLVEAHRDIAAEVGLDPGCELRRELCLRAVVDVSERDAVVVDARDRVAQREDLEPAGVGQDRPVPAHERVQSAELADHVVARPEMQVIRVAEQDLRPEVAHLVRVQRLDRPFRADGHEHGRPNLPVRGPEQRGARSPVHRRDLEDRARRDLARRRSSLLKVREGVHRISIASPNE
jgi:hypothetical protein